MIFRLANSVELNALSAVELERHPTEFHVAESADGAVYGAIALKISGRAGQIHSEAFLDFALADALRQQLWERLQSLATIMACPTLDARKRAVLGQNGFHAPNAAEANKFPADWGPYTAGWTTLKLRTEKALEMALEKEFAASRWKKGGKTRK